MPIADLHCDTVMRLQAGHDITTHSPEGQVDLPRLKEGKVGLQAFAAFVEPDGASAGHFESTVGKIDAITGLCAAHPEHFALVTTADDAQAAADSNRVGVLLTVENGQAIDEDLGKLAALRRRGVRSMTLVHSRNTNWAASCSQSGSSFDGLSKFGEQVVDAMVEMGMIVDVSHSHETTFWKAAARTRRAGRPLVATHSNAWELCPHPRNLKDDQIREIADQGGTIGINFFPLFLEANYYRAAGERNKSLVEQAGKEEESHRGDHAAQDRIFHRLGREYRERMTDLPVTSEAILRHIDHIVRIGGEECVSFGSDFDGILSTPEDVTGSDAYPMILAGLAERGYTESTIEKIAWGNVMRVLCAQS